MDRRRFLLTSLAGAFGAPLHAEAQQAGRMPRIGLIGLAQPNNPSVVPAQYLIQGLRERGWLEGQNIQFERREGFQEKYDSFAAELVASRVDLIVCFTTPATRAARRATQTIPIVMTSYGGDPVADGLIVSLARPGRNVTGLVGKVPGQEAKLYELLKQAVPGISRAAELWDPGFGPFPTSQNQMPPGLQILPVPVRSREHLKNQLQTIATPNNQALVVWGNPVLYTEYAAVADFALSRQLPSISQWRRFAMSGGLMSYWSSLQDLERRAAAHVEKILKGTKPGDIPVEQPTTFELVINAKTAKALGLRIPPSLLARADQVIE